MRNEQFRLCLPRSVLQPVPGEVEIVVVDDGSTDRTPEIICDVPHVRIRHELNRGKGAAILTAIERATGTHLLVFDADSEYDPNDISSLVVPIATGRAEVVYRRAGARRENEFPFAFLRRWQSRDDGVRQCPVRLGDLRSSHLPQTPPATAAARDEAERARIRA